MKLLKKILFLQVLLLLLSTNVKADDTARVTIYYNDINGHEIKSASSDTCKVGTVYTKSAPAINGYNYDSRASSPTTDCEEGNNIIAFVYQTKGNDKEGSVTVSCVDTNGNKLSKCTDGRSGTVGVEYYITPPTITGYKLVKIDGANNGTFKAGEIKVKFIFQKEGEEASNPDKQEEKPKEESPKEDTKVKEETKVDTKKQTTKKTTTKKKDTKIVTKKQEVKTAKKEETKKEEVKENLVIDNYVEEEYFESFFNNTSKDINIVNNKYKNKFILLGVFSSLSIVLFVIRKALFK